MTRLILCLLASTMLSAPTLALADDPVSNFLSKAVQEVRDSIDAAAATGWRDDSNDDDDRGGNDRGGDDEDDEDDDDD